MTYSVMPSPIGPLTLVARDGTLVAVRMEGHRRPPVAESAWGDRVDDAHPDATRQLREYFDGGRTAFQLPLAPEGTDFQRAVWGALQDIEYGDTTSYGALALRVGRPGASRAVGAAVGRNPISIVVPCHRVIGADGTLTGYAGGEDRKRYLLDMERGGRLL